MPRRGSFPLIFHWSGQPIESFRRLWRKACDRAGLIGFSFTASGEALLGTWKRLGPGGQVTARNLQTSTGDEAVAGW